MITALNIEDRRRKGLGGMVNILKRNRLRVEHLFCDTAAVKSVTYELYHGKVGWSAIDRFVKAQRGRILCSEDMALPAGCGYRRFCSRELSRRMCENAALYLLRVCGSKDIRVALIDKSGDSVRLCEHLSDHTEPLCVVTDAVELYIAQAENLLNGKGASMRICRNKACLRDADLIIAPDRIDDELDCSPDAVILSAEAPSVTQKAPVIYAYTFDLPPKYADMKPKYLEPMYFASALYAMASAHELGSELFRLCGDGSVIHTRKSLTAMLKKRLYPASDDLT